LASVDGRGFQEQRHTARSWRRLLQGPAVEIDNKVPWVIISDKAMKVRMLHCELKWEIPIKMIYVEKERGEERGERGKFVEGVVRR